ncbi:Fis family transcriptional regulator [Leptospira sp. 201903070]|uniref:Fis family transcriptional regulator n=1 Tax=Leptospira ainlahdjerensis TaxID=2810033 RepID=A0ABS2UDJ1_9LEPT|nr:helix-turn-helix domain-containing protein [Leptospira ainlahdjerensis]MBM9578023.1 Fis family transcriptional regulator [Leptospira ainlahdjerensis]
MLNFKHLPFVHPSLFNLLFSENSSSLLKKDEFSKAFEDWIRLSGALCGVLTFSFDQGKSLEEVSAVGYGEDGFFYSFLSRSTGNLEILNRENLPLWFSSDDHELFDPRSSGCLVVGIRGETFLDGFFLAEFLEKPSDSLLVLWGLVARKISESSSHSLSDLSVLKVSSSAPILRPEFPRKENVGEFLAEICGVTTMPDWLRRSSWVRILGASGAGKKTLGKWIHRTLSPEKGILVLGFLPEQISKLEKSFEEWSRMTNSGTILIEGAQKFSSVQQKFFFKILSGESSPFRLIFTEASGSEPNEIFRPFREFLLQRTISVPAFADLNSSQKESLVRFLLEELKESLGREDLRLSKLNLEKILRMDFNNNLSGLRNLLEESILSSSGSEIGIQEKKEGKDRIFTLPDSEDLDLRRAVEAVERQKILLAHKLFGGNQIRMAKALGISRGSLQYKLKQLEIG